MKIRNTIPFISKSGKINSGSVGGAVYHNGVQMLLTCYHAVNDQDMNWKKDLPINRTVEVEMDGTFYEIGTIKAGIRNAHVDVALIELSEGFIIEPKILKRDILAPDTSKLIKNMGVWMYGNSSHHMVGKYLEIENSVVFKYYYREKEQHEIVNTYKIRTSTTDPYFSQSGDSGSFVLTNWNRILGMLIGGQDRISYLIGAYTLKNQLLKLKNIKIKFTQ